MALGKLRIGTLELDGDFTMADLKTLSVYDLIVRGNITIDGAFTVNGSFVIEKRTDNPTAPEIGQMWYRTDL